jgi:hypothetical protein
MRLLHDVILMVDGEICDKIYDEICDVICDEICDVICDG